MIDDDPGEYPSGLYWLPWILKAEKFAYGELELLPNEFWTLTIAEFNVLMDGYYRRRRRRLEEAANWVCTLVNHFPMRGKNARTLRVEQLIGISPEERERIERLRARKRRETLNKEA